MSRIHVAPPTPSTPPVVGPLASRPAAAAAKSPLYLATDDNGGTLYVTDGSSWYKAGAGAVQSTGQVLGHYESQVVFSTAATSYTDVTGLTGMGVTGTGGDILMVANIPISHSTTTGRVILRVVDDLGTEVAAFPSAISNSNGQTLFATVVRKLPALANGVTRTYKVQIFAANGGTASVQANAANPATVRFTRA